MRNICYLLLLPFIAAACNAYESAPLSETVTSLSSVARKPAKFEGKTVQLDGHYFGWKHASCNFPKTFSSTQITRSDWVFSDGKRCCFVTGSAPQGLDPATASPVSVRLTAVVKQKNSKFYLEFVKVIVQN